MNTRKASLLIGWALAVSSSVAILSIPQASAATVSDAGHTSLAAVSLNRSATPDAQMTQVLAALETIPASLRDKDPREYSAEITKYLGNVHIKTFSGLSTQAVKGAATPTFSYWGCAVALASIVIQFGFPVGKIIAWIKEARAIWGGVRGIATAIRVGAAAAEIGPEAAQVLEQVLGIGPCF